MYPYELYESQYDPFENKYSARQADPVPIPPEAPPEKTVKKRKRFGFVAVLLAVSLCSGMAGGVVSYQLLDGGQTIRTASAPIIVESTAVKSGGSSSIAAIAAKASASVVEINVESTAVMPFFGESTTSGSGSGVILSQDGYIVTNDHVVENAGKIAVRTKDGDEYTAVLIGTDSKTDLAVIKIDAASMQPATFANSDEVVVGELAVAIGNSLGTLGGTVTDGIVSAKDREITIDNETMTLLQTSAAVNPGNSGGGLFDANGDLIGIVNAKSAGTDVEGLGFAIPSNLVREIAQNIISDGYVTGRPELGISVIEIQDAESAQMYRVSEPGLYVMQVNTQNGLQAGDRIVSVNGTEIATTAELKELLGEQSVGDSMDFVVVRNGEKLSLTVTIGEKVPEYMQQRLAQSKSF